VANNLLLISGSRTCTRGHEPEAWAREQLAAAVVGMAPSDIVLAGGAEGPDTWGAQIARSRGLLVEEFRLDGYRWRNGVRGAGWLDLVPKVDLARVHPLRRNAAMVAAAGVAVARGWTAACLGLIDPQSPTQGTGFTCTRAASASLPTLALTMPERTLDHPGWFPWTPSFGEAWGDAIALAHDPAARSAQLEAARATFQAGDIVFLDVETTGRHRDSAVIEIGVVRTCGTGKTVRVAYEARTPIPWGRCVVETQALEINGYTEEGWRDAIELPDLLADLDTLLWGLPILGGHNTPFDRAHIARSYARCELTMPRIHPRLLDTCQLVRRLLKKIGRVPDATLATACEYFQIPNDVRHRALADAWRTRELYLRLSASHATDTEPPEETADV
jgi:DNA polymerase III epsilon subunit-like protein